MEIPVVVQHRHVHLSEDDFKTLFENEEFALRRELEQRHQFVAKQTVAVHGPSGFFNEVSVIGPTRSQTQVELSASDAFSIGVKAPLRLSGDLDRSASVVLKTDHGEVKATASTIIPIRHLHLPPQIAEEARLSHHDVVTLKSKNHDDIVFDHVVVRVHPTFNPAFHLTKDESAPFWIQSGDIFIL